jgi:hypothetical protein
MANTYEAIATVTVGSGGAASITFSSIPATYTDLIIKTSARTNRSGQPVDTLVVQYNGSSSTLSQRALYGNGSTASSYSSATEQELVWVTGALATASTFGNGDIYIPNYAGSNYKSASADSVSETNIYSAYATFTAGLWSNTAAITSIVISSFTSSTIEQYSTATLYGIKKN